MAYSAMADEGTPLLEPTAAPPTSKILSETKVYPLIHLIRVDILAHIDTPLTYEQLCAPDSTYTIVRPLTEKYLQLQNQATVFCLLLNRVQFMHDAAQLSIATLSMSRATLCEILAVRVLRGWSERSLPLATVLLTPWAMFQGASPEVVEKAREEGDDELLEQSGNALEMAIVSGSKRFIRSPSCQKVIEGIWSGKIIYSAMNAHALIADNYKKRPIQLYNPHKAPLLDHYRLKVPKVRALIEYFNFLVLFILYILAIEGLEDSRLNWREGIFTVYALSFSLDKLAAVREHGLKVFSSSLVNGFDLVFMLIFGVYLSARTYGFHFDNAEALALGADWLAIGAVLIFPRLAFVTLANNLMVLSIRALLTEFFFLMGIGIFCFLGFLYALFTLGQGRFGLGQIGWWLLEVYFGLDASGFEAAHNFHPFLGPVLMISYALLSNTLLLTVLVAILGNTFATINADAAAESMFRKAVSTIEGVKADAVFSYQLPFNLPMVITLWPMSYVLSPRWFHKVNVFMIRLSNLPVLLIIALYERQKYRETSLLEQLGDFAERYVGSLPRRLRAAAGFDNFGSRHDVSMIFEIEREVGSFYRGWEDDIFDESEIQLPPAFDLDDADDDDSDDNGTFASVEGEKTDVEPAEAGLTSTDGPSGSGAAPGTPVRSGRRRNSSGQEVYVFPSSAPLTASPLRQQQDRQDPQGTTEVTSSQTSTTVSRRKSMSSAQPTPVRVTPYPPTRPQFPLRPRRNSSIHEPSPLARLFVKNERDNSVAERLRQRRESLVHALNLPSAVAQPAIAAAAMMLPQAVGTAARPRAHSRTGSVPLPLGEVPSRHIPRRSVGRIEEGKRLSFSQGSDRPGTQRGVDAEANSQAGPSKQVQFPRLGQNNAAPSSRSGSPARTGSGPSRKVDATSTGAHLDDELISPMTRTTSIRFAPDLAAGPSGISKSSHIAKASDVEAAALQRPQEDLALGARLEGIEERQRRIESLLERLVAGTAPTSAPPSRSR